MFKIFKADKDTYITDRVINKTRAYEANVGLAGTLDLFKLYGFTYSGSVPNVELSRILLHFDMSSLTSSIVSGLVDPTHDSFWASLTLRDVYGGQPTPDKFMVTVSPLSRSFDEGRGKDVVYYGDYDACNFITSSRGSLWIVSGCSDAGEISDAAPHDYFSGSIESTQYFDTGCEDLTVDVTEQVRRVLLGTLPDAGFRVAFSPVEESDDYTYFVKRFASRHAYDDSKHPRLLIGFDDSMRDHSQGLTTDSHGTIFLRNYDNGAPANLLSSSLPVSTLKLKLQLAVSGGFYDLGFSGSLHKFGTQDAVGIYSASVYIPSSDPIIASAFNASGSFIKLTPVWSTFDDSYAFLTGSQIKIARPIRGGNSLAPKNFVVSVCNMRSTYRHDERCQLRVNVFDYTSPFVTATRLAVNSPGAFQGIVTDAFYSVRDAVTQDIVIPFDVTHGSTRMSSDSDGLFFTLDMENLTREHTYVIDTMMIIGGEQQRYPNSSPVFKVSDVQ